MPKNPNTIQFSLPREYLDKLKTLSENEESIGLVAKRLLLSSLSGESEKTKFLSERLEILEKKIKSIEKKILSQSKNKI